MSRPKSLKKFSRTLCISLVSCLLLACASSQTKQPSLTQLDTAPLQVDPNLLVACPDLETADQLNAELEAKGFDMGKALEKITGLQQQYIMCAVKDDCLIAAEKAADKKAPTTCKQATDRLKVQTNDNSSTNK